jgi:hypothetical protein
MNRKISSALCCCALLFPGLLNSQVGYPTSPDTQRATYNNLLAQGRVLQNAIQTVPNYRTGGDDILAQQFQILCAAYVDFKRSLNTQQQYYGANDLAELDAGLDIIGGAFANCQQDLTAGRSPNYAMRTLCKVLGQGTGLWFRQLDQVSKRLRVGW